MFHTIQNVIRSLSILCHLLDLGKPLGKMLTESCVANNRYALIIAILLCDFTNYCTPMLLFRQHYYEYP